MAQMDKNYEEINQILQRASNRTLEMKTNNVKLLNKIGSEMNILLAKAQEIVRFCISDRNDFMKEIELIQFDFIELGKKIDQQFSLDKGTSKQVQIETQKTQSLLKTMLDLDNSDNESANQAPPSSINNLVIPDTCMPQFGIDQDKPNSKKNTRQLIIRDTIDSNFDEIFKPVNQNNKLDTIDENSVINDSFEKEIRTTRNFDETCLEENVNLEINDHAKKIIPDTSRVNFLKNSQSTPLAIKKKLQEHGLLDLTNSPYKSPIKSSKTNSPVKYVQSKFVMESPKNPTTSNIKTPVKVVLKTPTKSPSIFCKKPNFLTGNEISNENQEDSFDFSFEFREQIKSKSSLSSKSTQSNNNLKNSLSNTSVFSNSSTSKSPRAKMSQNNRNMNNTKRFKQLTMNEAFNPCGENKNIQNENKISSFFTRKESEKNLSSNNKNVNDLDETCLPNDELVRVKPEPYNYHEESNSKSLYKNDKTESNLAQNNRDYDDLANEYFNDFDRVPKRKDNQNQNNFKHVEVVRKHDERKKLPTWSCKECETYWNSVPEDKRPKRMEESCRHRAKYQPPATPEHYWSVAFPTTQECIERGYGGVLAQNDRDDEISKRPRRKRPLKLIANDDKNEENDINDFDFGD
ncbi:unnamed protein product [Brachionus calyciflorus]|uniref:DNA endonuclease activator Ctp1 C-terminal domain-containing protein n=1 Tax=Brachionus calyciflorus TaxID=104777 RepID=A0A813MKJ7_9BILA|nr:unnamed protein product [Brachionus calyciflorus]